MSEATSEAQILKPLKHSVCGSAAELFEAHFHDIARGLGRLGVQAADIEDAAQDVFLVVHRRWADFERRSSLKTWLWGIALQTARHYRRQRLARAARWLLFRAEQALSAVKVSSPHEQLETEQAAHALGLLLASLNSGQRELFVLIALEECTVAEAARLLQLPVTTAHSRYKKACRILEQRLERQRLSSPEEMA